MKDDSLLQARHETTSYFYSWKDLSFQLFGSLHEKKKCKTLESKSINYPRGAEFKAIIHTWKMLILATNLGLILCFYL